MSDKKTKTYEYLFRVFRGYYLEKNVSRSFNKINKDINAYLSDTSLPDSDENDMLLYIVVDGEAVDFGKAMRQIEKSIYYVYRYVSRKDTTKCVIVMRPPLGMKSSFKKFLESKYSEMYDMSLLANSGVRTEFITGKGDEYLPAYRVMTRDDDYFKDHILSLIHGMSDKEIDRIRKKEYDSILNINNQKY